MKSRDVIVVGGGVVGLCCAYYLLLAGHQVSIVERDGQGDDRCSLGNAGMVVPSHFVPFAAPGMIGLGLKMLTKRDSPLSISPGLSLSLLRWLLNFARSCSIDHVREASPLLLKLSNSSVDCFKEISDITNNQFGLVKHGLLMLFKSERALDHEIKLVEMARKLGMQAKILTNAETAILDPGVKMDVVGSVYFPDDCHLNPADLYKTLVALVETNGGEILWNSEQIEWKTNGHSIKAIRTKHGDMTADEFVLSAGAWSSEILSKLSLRIPLQPGKGYSVTLDNPVQLPQVCSILSEARVAVTPMGSRLRVGGTLEIGQLNMKVNSRRVTGISQAFLSYFPEFSSIDFDLSNVWTGLRPCSPDGLPYVGRLISHNNLTVAFGHGMMGVSLAPVTGRLVAEILSNEKPSIDIVQLSPNRYA